MSRTSSMPERIMTSRSRPTVTEKPVHSAGAGRPRRPAAVVAGPAARAAADLTDHVDLEAGLDEREEPGAHARGHGLAEPRVEDRAGEELAQREGDLVGPH